MQAASNLFDQAIGRPLANRSYRAMSRAIKGMQRAGLSMVHTARPFAFYRTAFYGGQSAPQLLASLRGTRIVDVGCGYTPYAPDSMFQACAKAGIEFYGADPLLAAAPRPGVRERLVSAASGGSGRFMAQPRGMKRALGASGQSLPFDTGTIDEVLSSYLLFVWIRDEPTLADIFGELHRILRPGGRIKLFPTPEWHYLAPRDGELSALLSQFTVSQTFIRTHFRWGTTPGMLTQLEKVNATSD